MSACVCVYVFGLSRSYRINFLHARISQRVIAVTCICVYKKKKKTTNSMRALQRVNEKLFIISSPSARLKAELNFHCVQRKKKTNHIKLFVSLACQFSGRCNGSVRTGSSDRDRDRADARQRVWRDKGDARRRCTCVGAVVAVVRPSARAGLRPAHIRDPVSSPRCDAIR